MDTRALGKALGRWNAVLCSWRQVRSERRPAWTPAAAVILWTFGFGFSAGSRADGGALPPFHEMQHVAVKSKHGVRVVPVEQIDWFESAGNYVRLHVGSERFLLRQTMQGLEQKLDPTQFVRIHRTTIVNVQRIRDTRPASHGDHIVVLHDGTQLQMSRAYRERLEGSPP